MKIAVDIDDVIADLVPSMNQYFNDTYGAHVTKEECLDFSLTDVWKRSREEVIKIITDYYQTPYFQKVVPMKDSVESLIYLSKKHELFAVTGRPVAIENFTLQWINQYFPKLFKEVHHTNLLIHETNGHKKKSEICKTISADLIIEDNFDYASDCASCGITTFLYDEPWNKDKVLLPNMIRVKNWKDVIVKFKEKYE